MPHGTDDKVLTSRIATTPRNIQFLLTWQNKQHRNCVINNHDKEIIQLYLFANYSKIFNRVEQKSRL